MYIFLKLHAVTVKLRNADWNWKQTAAINFSPRKIIKLQL